MCTKNHKKLDNPSSSYGKKNWCVFMQLIFCIETMDGFAALREKTRPIREEKRLGNIILSRRYKLRNA